MNNKLFLFPALALLFALLFSCRNDFLAETEARNQSELPALTSKIISLNESNHKSKILPELKFAKQTLANKSDNAFGKVVNFGDSISIDTDNVIYIENGPNYHTYTFNINRTNPQPNDLVENLLLTPLPDGTYKEFLVSYNLSPQEKQRVENGQTVDTKGKTIIKELNLGTFNVNNQLAKTTVVCSWNSSTYWKACKSGHHNESNFQDTNPGSFFNWMNCPFTGSDAPGAFTVTSYDCVEVLTTSWDDGTGNNGGGDGYGGPVYCPECPAPAEPCPEGSILNSPLDPSSSLSGDCNPLIPTMPNLGGSPNTKTPCEKIKDQRNDNNFKKRLDTLQGNTGMIRETGYIQKWGGAYEYKDNANATSTSNTLSLPTISSNTYIKGFTHTHVDDYTITNADGNIVERKGIKMFSPADVSYFMAIIQNAQNLGKTLNDSYAGMVTSTANYQIRFTGNQYQIKTFTDQQLIKHQNDFAKFMKAFMNNPAKLELKFLQYISEKMNLKGISLYRLNSDGTTTEIKLNAGKTDTVETTCP